MGPDDILLIVMLAALTLYAILGGADFGAGVWEFTSALQSTEKERRHIYGAIGPVWEANHVWLIFVMVILINGFPSAFAALSRALWVPLLLALCGIVFRGASFAFRSYTRQVDSSSRMWELLFASASTATPLFLGACAGAVASGNLEIDQSGNFSGDYQIGWLSPLAIFSGFYSVGMCAYLAAVFLTREAFIADDADLQRIWRQRALSTGLWMGLLSAGGLAMVWLESPTLASGFISKGWPLIILSFLCGVGSLIEVWRACFNRAAIAASGAVATVICGWGISQYPMIVPPAISSESARAPDNILWAMVAVIGLGSILLLPALGYLLTLFKSHPDRT